VLTVEEERVYGLVGAGEMAGYDAPVGVLAVAVVHSRAAPVVRN